MTISEEVDAKVVREQIHFRLELRSVDLYKLVLGQVSLGVVASVWVLQC